MSEIKSKLKDGRVYRSAELFEAQEDYMVEGYAALWQPYELFKSDGVQYYEKINKEAFDEADISDVIFQFDHAGMVHARQSNGTLELEVDDVGLKVIADLSKTTESRKLYESIKEKMIKEMSWAFTVEEEAYNSETRTRTITKVEKVYDVSSVSIPANSNTYINARTIDGVIELQKRSERAHEEARLRLQLKLKQRRNKNGN